jgi:3-methyl-2-oxobutanoate hydroxymethyltransferase
VCGRSGAGAPGADPKVSTERGTSRKRIGTGDLREMKARGEKIAALTAYDWLFARLLDAAGIDVVLVGDSVAQVVLGYDSTLPVTLDEMIHHARAVRRGVERALVVVDLPFLTYQVSTEEALRNAGRVMKETGASAVKLEGGSPPRRETVRALVDAGIPVMAHLGYTPQSVNVTGTRVQGRDPAARERLREQARALEDAGAFALVLELVPRALACDVSAELVIPTIGIGAGVGCDGQVLVLHDMLGLNPDFSPRFLRRFAEVGEVARAGVDAYVRAVREGEYPAAEHTFE